MFNAAIHSVSFPDAIFEAVKNKKITMGDFYLYSCIYAYTISLGGCTLSNETIAKEIGFSERGIRKSRANLEKAGFIKTVIEDGNHRIMRVNIFKDEFLPTPRPARAKRDNRDFAAREYVLKTVREFIQKYETILSVPISDFWMDLDDNGKIFWKDKNDVAIVRIDNYKKVAIFNQNAPASLKSGYCTSKQSEVVWNTIYRHQKRYLEEIETFKKMYEEYL